MPEYEALTLEQALAHLRDGTGKVEGKILDHWRPMRRRDNVLEHMDEHSWRTVAFIFAWSFRLVKEEPEIVKPMVMATSAPETRFMMTCVPGGDYIWAGRPRAQQERLDALLDKFVEVTADWVSPHNPTFLNLRDFLRAEKEAK